MVTLSTLARQAQSTKISAFFTHFCVAFFLLLPHILLCRHFCAIKECYKKKRNLVSGWKDLMSFLIRLASYSRSTYSYKDTHTQVCSRHAG